MMKRLIVIGALLTAGLWGSAAVGTAQAADGGNSAAAHACQQGGYATLMGTDGTVFNNAGECTSYAAHGGTLVPLRHAQITASDALQYVSYGVCFVVQVTGTGFAPNSPITINGSPTPVNYISNCQYGPPPTTDANGNFTGYVTINAYQYNGGCTPYTETLTATDASGTSASTTYAYNAQFC